MKTLCTLRTIWKLINTLRKSFKFKNEKKILNKFKCLKINLKIFLFNGCYNLTTLLFFLPIVCVIIGVNDEAY